MHHSFDTSTGTYSTDVQPDIGNISRDDVRKAILEEGVTNVGVCAFLDCHSLKEVTFCPGIKDIDDYAFRRCVSLNSLALPEGLERIGRRAFAGCTGLKEVTIPNGCMVEPDAFDDSVVLHTEGE